MEIILSNAVITHLGLKKLSQFGVTEDEIRWDRAKVTIDLNDHNLAKVKKLEGWLQECQELHGVKTVLWEIKIWQEARQDVGSVMVPKLKHLEPLLFAYMKKLPHHWLFQQQDKLSDAMLPYYVSRIEYHEERKERDWHHPAFVRVTCIYERYGRKRETSFDFYSSDVCGKRIRQILLKYSLFPETVELVEKHKLEVERYNKLIPQVGKQFTVSGIAADADVPDKSDWGNHIFTFADDRRKNRVVIDTFIDAEDEEEERRRSEPYYSIWYWGQDTIKNEDEEDTEVDDVSKTPSVDIPVQPFLIVFDLFRHLRLSVYVKYMTEYVYDKQLANKLILPQEIKSLISMLVEHKEGNFKDIVAGKGGGAIILLTGAPGVGKTLTAEIFAEADEKPLYSVQASQLGTDPEELEKQLLLVLKRAARWDAVMLLDEADVYVHERGNDLTQNAIVGVFLRVLEYHSSVLFLTTNRPDLVDDAIASRCVARIDYEYPDKENQKKIWKVLAEASSINIDEKEYSAFAEKHPKISGRDVKNLLKLANLISTTQKKPITCESIEYVLHFKPTVDKSHAKSS